MCEKKREREKLTKIKKKKNQHEIRQNQQAIIKSKKKKKKRIKRQLRRPLELQANQLSSFQLGSVPPIFSISILWFVYSTDFNDKEEKTTTTTLKIKQTRSNRISRGRFILVGSTNRNLSL